MIVKGGFVHVAFALIKRITIEAKDGERAFRAAHTLKGVCINLGFDRLYNVSAELTEKLRGREIEESEELFEQVEKEYYALIAVLKQYESEL